MSDPARRGLRRPFRTLTDGAGFVVAGILGGLAKARGGKAVHPHGDTYSARLLIDGTDAAPAASQFLAIPGEWPAIVRFSRSLGLPRPLPDLLGMSIRVSDAYGEGRHQDLLFVTSVDAPVLHHLFLPAGDVQQRPYSCSLPYRAGDEKFLIGVRPDPRSPRPEGGTELERLERAVRSGELRFDLVVAPLLGRFRRVGTLRLVAPLPDTLDALRFNPPVNTGGGLEPIGTLNRWRGFAYPLSQRAWGSGGGRARAQRDADAEATELASRGATGTAPVERARTGDPTP
jgi:hypothetical protein